MLRCAEVYRSEWRGAQRCMGVCRGVWMGVWRCPDVCRDTWRCVEVHRWVHEGVQRGTERCTQVHREMHRVDCHWLPLANIDLVDDNWEFKVLRIF